VRFRPVSAAETPEAVEELCLAYRHVLNQGKVPPLLADACLIFDFLSIHPFRDGNGRVSRLLTLLVLYQHGYEVGRYISLERLIEETRADYYAVLHRSSEGWHEDRHDILPWLNYFLSIVRRAYVELESRVGQVKAPRGAKTTLIESAVASFPGEFSLADLERACPGVSRDLARRVLQQLQREGRVECVGRGPGASVPELPGCHSQGATEEEALANLERAIREYLVVAAELSPPVGDARDVEAQEDEEDLAAFRERAGEPLLDLEDMVWDLKRRGRI